MEPPARAEIIDGKAIAARVKARVATAAQRLADAGITPCLAVVRVGDDHSSAIYVRNKERAAAKVGIQSRHIHLPADVSADDLDVALSQLLDGELGPRRAVAAWSCQA